MIPDNTTTFGVGVLALDYTRNKLRVSTDLTYQRQVVDGYVSSMFVQAGLPVPKPPSAKVYLNQPWEYVDQDDRFAVLWGEYDITRDITVYAGYGQSEWNSDVFVGDSPQIINPAGDYRQTLFSVSFHRKRRSATAGWRARAQTGAVKHQFTAQVLDVPYSQRSFGVPGGVGEPISSNIYNPIRVSARSDARERRIPTFRSETINRSFGFADKLSLFAERVVLTVGGRVQHIGVRGFNVTTGALLPTSYNETAFTPGVGVAVKPLARLTFYGNYIEAMQQGTVVQPPNVNAGDVFPPYRSRQYEVGAKYNFGAAGVSPAAFQIAQPNAITTLLPGGQPRFDVHGEQRNRGLDLNVFGSMGRRVRLLGGATFLDGVLTRTATASDGTNNNGKLAPGVPRVQFNLYGEYDVPALRGLTLTGRNISTSEEFINAANTQKIPGWTRFDIGGRYRFSYNESPVTLRFAVENLLNSSYYASSAFGRLTRDSPRTFQASLDIDVLSLFSDSQR